METLDRKFKFKAVSLKTKKTYTEKNAIVFLAKDALLPQLLEEYSKLCVKAGVDDRQLQGVQLLRERVRTWQSKNEKKVHYPDVDAGKEEKRVCKPNK